MAASAPVLVTRRCTECPNPVEGRRLTCSPRCRKKRHERNRTQRAPSTTPPKDAVDAAQELLKEELRPVVREAITEDLLDSIRTLVGSLPAAIAAAVEDLGDESNTPDARDRRQRAYTLLMRHSIGNTNLVPDINESKRQALTVHFDLPRPEGGLVSDGGTETIQTKECDTCHHHKPLDEFVGSSDRCQECFGRMREASRELIAGG